LLGVAVLVSGLYFKLAYPHVKTDTLHVEPHFEFNEESPSEFTLYYHIKSTSQRPVHIVGSAEACRPLVCIQCSPLPMTIEPNGRARLKVHVLLRPGIPAHTTIQEELILYTDVREQQELTLPIRGTITREA